LDTGTEPARLLVIENPVRIGLVPLRDVIAIALLLERGTTVQVQTPETGHLFNSAGRIPGSIARSRRDEFVRRLGRTTRLAARHISGRGELLT
jgi:hypothetical protein